MEDHYVRVHTRAGSALLLMPLGQAIAEAAPLAGVKTHRSWWVARNAVIRTEGGPRAMRLHLSNGLVAPVSRAAVATLRKDGWLAAEPGNGGTE
jgi:DNA-binding LytR/AlgR family response regulator